MDARVNITLPPDLLQQADEAARAEHLTRSGFVREALKARLRSEGTSPVRESPLTAEESPAAYAVRPAGPPALEVVLDRLRAFCAARDDIVLAYVFGSVANGTAGPHSDVDIAVLLPYEGTDRQSRFRTQLDLAGRLGSVLGVPRVDVLVLNDAPYVLAHRAVYRGCLAHGQGHPQRPDFESRVLGLYVDYVPVIDEFERALRVRLKRGGFLAG